MEWGEWQRRKTSWKINMSSDMGRTAKNSMSKAAQTNYSNAPERRNGTGGRHKTAA